MRRLLGAALAVGCAVATLSAQPPAAQTQPAVDSSTSIPSEPSGESATLSYFNRPIVVLRARVLGRGPSERAANAARVLDELASVGEIGPVTSQPISGGVLFLVGSRVVFGLAPSD